MRTAYPLPTKHTLHNEWEMGHDRIVHTVSFNQGMHGQGRVHSNDQIIAVEGLEHGHETGLPLFLVDLFLFGKIKVIEFRVVLQHVASAYDQERELALKFRDDMLTENVGNLFLDGRLLAEQGTGHGTQNGQSAILLTRQLHRRLVRLEQVVQESEDRKERCLWTVFGKGDKEIQCGGRRTLEVFEWVRFLLHVFHGIIFPEFLVYWDGGSEVVYKGFGKHTRIPK